MDEFYKYRSLGAKYDALDKAHQGYWNSTWGRYQHGIMNGVGQFLESIGSSVGYSGYQNYLDYYGQ